MSRRLYAAFFGVSGKIASLEHELRSIHEAVGDDVRSLGLIGLHRILKTPHVVSYRN
jgi:hypothetical protein